MPDAVTDAGGDARQGRRRAFAAARGYALVAIAACSWGTWPLILRPAEKIAPMPPALESAIMMTVLTLVSGPFSRLDRPTRIRAEVASGTYLGRTWRDWAGIAWLGVADAMNVYLFFGAYQRTTVAVAVLTHYLTPIFVAMTAPLVLRERADARTYVAVATAFAGLVLLLAPWDGAARAAGLVGAAFGAGSAVLYASNVLVSKGLTAFSASELMFFHGFLAVPILALLVPREAWSTLDARAVGIVALGSVGPGALAGLFFVWGLRRVPASHASTLTLLEPLVAVLVGALAFGETLPARAMVGGALILGGAALVVARRAAAAPSASG
jgi:drug/metabolite transporter (DMT)-like permease